MTRHPQTIDAECGICMEPYVEVREDTDGVDSSITSQRGVGDLSGAKRSVAETCTRRVSAGGRLSA
ncbi:hypothetical protein RJZ56_004152 [Blastomyces dermatitidis]